jgi:hypothetical protein
VEKHLTSSLADISYYNKLNDFMTIFDLDPDVVVKDLVEYYGKDALKLMDLLVKYNNTPAVLRK